MKIRLYSDIHLDGYDLNTRWYPPALPNDKETTLILAGDIWIGSKFILCGSESWLSNVAVRFKQILIVLGNHDYWPQGDLTIKNGADKLRTILSHHCLYNVHILDCNIFEDENVLFVGATLWTDMNKLDPLTMHRMNSVMSYDGKIAYNTAPGGVFHRWTSDRWVTEHIRHRKYISDTVEQNKDKRIVVITHHVPLHTLIHPDYAGDAANGYYVSDLSDIILDNKHIAAWLFGHTHYNTDIMFEHCRMINNCVGYQGEHFEQRGVVKHEIIEI